MTEAKIEHKTYDESKLEIPYGWYSLGLNENLIWVSSSQITEKIYSGYELFTPLKTKDWHPSKKMREEFKKITGKELDIEKVMEGGHELLLMQRRWTYNNCIYYDDITITDLLLWIIKKVFKLGSYKHFKMIFERGRLIRQGYK